MFLQSKTGEIIEMILTKNILIEYSQAEPTKKCKFDFTRISWKATSDLRWMPRIPFQYYMLGFRDFINSGTFESPEASDVASCFISLVLEKLEEHSDYILSLMPELLPTIEYVAKNQTKFEAEKSIYGSFLEQFKRIQTLYTMLGC